MSSCGLSSAETEEFDLYIYICVYTGSFVASHTLQENNLWRKVLRERFCGGGE